MPTCSICGAPCRDDAAFCPNCGARFAAPDEMEEPVEQAIEDEIIVVEDAPAEEPLVDEMIAQAQEAPEAVEELADAVEEAAEEAAETVEAVVEDVEEAVAESADEAAEVVEDVQEAADEVIADVEEVVAEEVEAVADAEEVGAVEEGAFNPYAGAFDHETAPRPNPDTPRPQPAVAYKVYTTAGGQADAQQQGEYVYTGRRSYPAPNKVQYREALRKGWEDFRSMPSWMAKVLLLGLVSLVPILNFFSVGFAMRWGARAAFNDGRNDLKIFQEGAFVLGFFAFVINLIWGIAFSIVSIIPLVGFVAVILAAPLMQLCIMRVALSRQFGDAFTFERIWPTFKENFGSTMALFWLPSLVTVAAALIFSFVAAIFSGILMAAVYNESALIIFALFGLLLLIVCAYVMCVLSVGVELVVVRAFGYWIADAQPDWIVDARAIGADRID